MISLVGGMHAGAENYCFNTVLKTNILPSAVLRGNEVHLLRVQFLGNASLGESQLDWRGSYLEWHPSHLIKDYEPDFQHYVFLH